MSDRPKFRYINEAAGAFVLVTLLLFLVFLSRAAWLQHLFDPGKVLYVLMPPEGSFGLREGSEIVVLGTQAGRVSDITFESELSDITFETDLRDSPFHTEERMVAVVEVRDDFARFFRIDSVAMIRKTYGIAGDTFLDVTLGVGQPLDWSPAIIHAQTGRSTTERLDATIDDLRRRLLPTIDELRVGIQKWSDVADYLREPQRDFAPLFDDLKAISGGIRGGEGTLGRLVADEKMANDVAQAIASISRASDDLDPLLMELRKVSEDARVISGRLKSESEQLPDMVDRLHKTITEIQMFVGDLRESGSDLPQTTESVRDAALRLPELITEARSAVRSIRQLAESLKQRYAPLSPEQPQAPKRVTPREATP